MSNEYFMCNGIVEGGCARSDLLFLSKRNHVSTVKLLYTKHTLIFEWAIKFMGGKKIH